MFSAAAYAFKRLLRTHTQHRYVHSNAVSRHAKDLRRQHFEGHAPERLDGRVALGVRGKRKEVRLVVEIHHNQFDMLLLAPWPFAARRIDGSTFRRCAKIGNSGAQGMVRFELVLLQAFPSDGACATSRAIHPLFDGAPFKRYTPWRDVGVVHDVHPYRTQEILALVRLVKSVRCQDFVSTVTRWPSRQTILQRELVLRVEGNSDVLHPEGEARRRVTAEMLPGGSCIELAADHVTLRKQDQGRCMLDL